MSMNDSNVEELIVEITKQDVESEAPEEMALFYELAHD